MWPWTLSYIAFYLCQRRAYGAVLLFPQPLLPARRISASILAERSEVRILCQAHPHPGLNGHLLNGFRASPRHNLYIPVKR